MLNVPISYGPNGPTTTPRRAGGRKRHRAAQALTAGLAMSSLVFAGSSLPWAQGASASGTYLTFSTGGPWGTTWSYNPYAPDYPGNPASYATMHLALWAPPTLTDWIPQLASSWSLNGRNLTVQLRSGAKWQDGQAVTSTDLLDTVLLDGTSGGAEWSAISGVSAPNSSEVVFTLLPGELLASAEADILDIAPVPSSEYGQFVTSSLEADDVAYYNEERANPTAATKMSQYAAMGAVFKKLAAYNPATLVGNGPFQLTSMTGHEVVLQKWSGFYDASQIHPGGIDYLNGTSNDVIYGPLLSGQLDFSDVYMPPTIASRWAKTSGAHTALVPSIPFTFVFNSHAAPLDNVAVRQAIAYVVNRKSVIALTYGSTYAGGSVEVHPDGLAPQVESLYMTPSQVGALNAYPLDPAKAAKLLESAGMTERGGEWYLANGKQFTLTIQVGAGGTDSVQSSEVAGDDLSTFGIKTSVDAESNALVGSNFHSGAFQIMQQDVWTENPIGEFDYLLGTSNNFTSLGSYAGQRGVGFGPDINVPGLGVVNVPVTLDKELAATAPGAQMDALTAAWAKVINEQMPYLQYGNKVYQFTYSSQRFSDWPPSSNEVWAVVANTEGPGMLLAMEDGYIRPKG